VKIHNVQKIDFDGKNMVLAVDGRVYRVGLPSVSGRLANASDASRRSYSISPSGYGIHWPDIDEDLTIDGLIASAPPVQLKNRGIDVFAAASPSTASEVNSQKEDMRSYSFASLRPGAFALRKAQTAMNENERHLTQRRKGAKTQRSGKRPR